MDYSSLSSQVLAEQVYWLMHRCWNGDINAYPLLKEAQEEQRKRGQNFRGEKVVI